MGYERRTSETHGIYVNFVPDEALQGLEGRLGMTLAPGVKDMSTGGFFWDRNLDADLQRLKDDFRVDVLVSLMEPYEYEKYCIPNLLNKAEERGIEVEPFAIKDVSIPLETKAREYKEFIYRIAEALEREKVVVVHCRGGRGRTGLVAASVLVALEYSAVEAVETVREVRSGTIETQAQEDYVHEFEKEVRS